MPRWRGRAWWWLGGLWVVLTGCGLGSYGEAGDPGAYATYDGGDASAGPDSDAADADAAAAGSFPLARGGIEIDRVEANQGVGVLIGAGGAGVSEDERVAPLVKHRVTLVRALWALPDDWEPRELEGRLIITDRDGTEQIFVHTKWVQDEATEDDLSRSFFWGLSAEQVRPGLEYRVELRETSAEHGDLSEPSPLVRLPADGGRAWVGVGAEDLVMKVVLVPFAYDDGAGCVTTADTSEATMGRFEDAIYMRNPLERIELEVHAPVAWDTPLHSFTPLNAFLAGLRFDEGAPPEAYYYGLIDVCADGLGNAGGMAIGIPDDPINESSAALRVASGLSIEPDWSAETFVHELGHSQGRRHVACNGDEGGPDEQYPHEGGELGQQWGFGVVDFGLRNPAAHKDYMTYCHPAWVGAWGWNEVYPVIEGLSDWGVHTAHTAQRGEAPGVDALAVEAPYEGSLLMGAIEPDNEAHWLTVPGVVPVAGVPGAVQVEFYEGDALLARVPAHAQPMQDGDGGTLIMAPLPDGWSSVTRIAWVEAGRRSVVPRAAIAPHHHHRVVRR